MVKGRYDKQACQVEISVAVRHGKDTTGVPNFGCEFLWVVFNEGCCYTEKAAEQ